MGLVQGVFQSNTAYFSTFPYRLLISILSVLRFSLIYIKKEWQICYRKPDNRLNYPLLYVHSNKKCNKKKKKKKKNVIATLRNFLVTSAIFDGMLGCRISIEREPC